MDAGLKRDVPSFEDSGGEFSVVKDLTLSLYAKRRKSQTFVKKAGEQHDDTTNNRACVVYAEREQHEPAPKQFFSALLRERILPICKLLPAFRSRNIIRKSFALKHETRSVLLPFGIGRRAGRGPCRKNFRWGKELRTEGVALPPRAEMCGRGHAVTWARFSFGC